MESNNNYNIKNTMNSINLYTQYNIYKQKMIKKNYKYDNYDEWMRKRNTKVNMATAGIEKLKGKNISMKKLNKNFDKDPDEFKRNVLNESMDPNSVDRSRYIKFTLFNFFIIYTTNPDLETDNEFIKNMRWVKERLEEIAEMTDFKLEPYELTLCASFDDLDEFYNYEAPKWVTGFTWGNQVFMKAPNIYKGELYYNIVLHEALHVMFWNNVKVKGGTISRKDEEGFVTYFSTPLKKWLHELNKFKNFYYYERAIDIQEWYLTYGMKYVLKKIIKW